MSMLRRVLVLMLIGAALGEGVGTLVARSFIPWYWSPGDVMKNSQQLLNAPEVVRGTIDQMVRYQLTGSAVGAVVVLIAGLLLQRALGKRKEGATAPSTP
jgi:hypothetical protein